MCEVARALLGGVVVLSGAVWVGGFVVLVIVDQVARRTIDPAERTAFFQMLGRVYGLVGGLALALGLASGAFLVYDRRWDAVLTLTAVAAVGLVAATVIGVAQARRMTRLRRGALEHPDDTALAGRVRRGTRTAGILRSLIGVVSLALLALGVVLAT